ncbi:hypothetical protein DACRYDRAFT_111659 [Dacryopinax primogenitus]|uniref:WD40 repeat-like protein n=1 Tax=Dacryopinax primogenitus (strain DJM 731) TaxID=1858805 RepID=M5FW65_DACPD|nr:uncharacterized protein DACRYDRAFT_111659 [Dacryopinax primogenitus]EJT97616.1 hypothetical protein DACRYDRAFT_111659 [Dacryopinax primogenitus]
MRCQEARDSPVDDDDVKFWVKFDGGVSDSEGKGECQDEGYVQVPMPNGCKRSACSDMGELAARRKLWYQEEVRNLAKNGLAVCDPPILCPDGMTLHWKRLKNDSFEKDSCVVGPSSTVKRSRENMRENHGGLGADLESESAHEQEVTPVISPSLPVAPSVGQRSYSSSMPQGLTPPPIAVLEVDSPEQNTSSVSDRDEIYGNDCQDTENYRSDHGEETDAKKTADSEEEEDGLDEDVKSDESDDSSSSSMITRSSPNGSLLSSHEIVPSHMDRSISHVIDLTLESDDETNGSQSSRATAREPSYAPSTETESETEDSCTESDDTSPASTSPERSRQEFRRTAVQGKAEAASRFTKSSHVASRRLPAKRIFEPGTSKVVRIIKDGTKKGRRIFRMGDDVVTVSHAGSLDRISSDKKWINRASCEVDMDKPLNYVFDAAPLDMDTIIIPFDCTASEGRSNSPGNIGIFTWTSPMTKPVASWPTQQPHDARGVRALTTNNGMLYTGGYDSTLTLWKFTDDKEVKSTQHLRKLHTSRIAALACSSKRDWLFSAGKIRGNKAEMVALLDIRADRHVQNFPGSYPVQQMQEHPQNPNVILCESVAIRDQFMLIDVRIKKPLPNFGDTEVRRYGPSFDFRTPFFGNTDEVSKTSTKAALWADRLAKGIGNYTIRVWDLRNTQQFQDVKIANKGAHRTIAHLLLEPQGIVALRND